MPKKTLQLLLVLLLLTPALSAAAPVAVTGAVSGPGGSPVQGARALLLPLVNATEAARLEMDGKADPEPVATAAVAADGTFRLQAPSAGMWKVAVQAQGTVPQEILLQPLLEETELPALKLESDAKLQVRVAGPDGKPLAGVRVRAGEVVALARLFRTEMMRWRNSDRMAVTDDKGVAALPRGSRERLLVRAGVAGQPFVQQEEVRSGSVSFRLASGTTREIRVMDAEGKKPVPNLWVQVGDHRWTAGRTSEDGRFAVPLAPKRKEKVFLLAEDGRRLESYAEPLKKGDDQKGEEGPKVLRLPDLQTLAGRVVSLADGRPVAGALVWNTEPAEAKATGADGAYKVAVVSGRDAWLQAAASGFLPADAQVGVQTGMRRGPTLGLEPALAAAGVVVDEQGRPVAGVQIQAAPLPNRMRTTAAFRSGSSARSSATGRFRLPGLVAGIGYDVRLSKAGFAPASSEIPPLSGRGTSDLRVVLRKGRLAFGRVVDRSERPIVGSRVELRQAPTGDMRTWLRRMRTGGDDRKYEAVADATGRFEVRDLPAGTFELTARGSGFAPLTVPGLAIPEAGGGGIDLGTVVLGPGVEIEGYVVDPNGQPVEGVEIRVAETEADPMARYFSQGEEDEPAAVSAQDGFFRVPDRSAGEIVDLDASRPGYAPAVAAGVQVPAEPPVRLVLRPSAAVEGRTVDPDGKPVAGARVNIFPSDPMAVGGTRVFGASRARQAVSDDTGFFRVEDVIPGSFELLAMAAGYQRSELKNLEVRPGQDLRGTEVVLMPGAVVEGRVLSPSGQPLPGAEVGIVDPTVDFFFGNATTDGDGRYRLEGIAPGTHSVQAEHESYRRAVKELEVRLGENTLDLRLEGGAEISGRVVDEGGVPIPSARVSLREGPRSWSQPGAVSGADGSFRLDGVADGTYRVQAEKEGFARTREGVEVTVAGSSVSGVEIKLSAGGAIVGQLSGLEFT
ncbi:MAG TPA: carboxypeptidase regulatory-like domain-containing protein, partial [Thermoanaerobaculia bacterium]|nr:carboxypeptidase regulatory-like domain-containing protein [Thermoanaerobaculia bacterium]